MLRAVPLPPLFCVPVICAETEGVAVAQALATAVPVPAASPAPAADALPMGLPLPLAPPSGLGVAPLPEGNGVSVGSAVPLGEGAALGVAAELALTLCVPRAVRLAREALGQALADTLGVALPLPVGRLLTEALRDAAGEALGGGLTLAPLAGLPLGVLEGSALPLAAAGVLLREAEARLVPEPPPANAAVLEAVLSALSVAPPRAGEALAGALAVEECVAALGVTDAVPSRDAEEDCVEVVQGVGPPVAVAAPLAVAPPFSLEDAAGVGVLPGAEGEGMVVGDTLPAEELERGVALEQGEVCVEGEEEAQGVEEGVSLALAEKEEEGEGEGEESGELLPPACEALAALLAVGRKGEALGLREEQGVGEVVVHEEGVGEAVVEYEVEAVAAEVRELPCGGLALMVREAQPVPLALWLLLLHSLAQPLAVAPWREALGEPNGDADCVTPPLRLALTVLGWENVAGIVLVGVKERRSEALAQLVAKAKEALTGAVPVGVRLGEGERAEEALLQGLAEAAAETLACTVILGLGL